MTAATTPDIAPRIVDGEPVCSHHECPSWYDGDHCHLEVHPPQYWDACPSGLRRQRDALQAERDAALDCINRNTQRIVDAGIGCKPNDEPYLLTAAVTLALHEISKLRASGTELIVVAPHSNVGIGEVERKPIDIELPTAGAMGHGHD